MGEYFEIAKQLVRSSEPEKVEVIKCYLCRKEIQEYQIGRQYVNGQVICERCLERGE